MRICLRTSPVVALATVGVLCAAGFSGCSTPGETSHPAATAQDFPRAANGKPDFSGVWAGPGFRHTGKDTDSATVRLYTDAKMSPMTPEGKSLFFRPHTGNVRIDDPTAVCLPNGLTRQIPSPYAQQFIQSPDQLVILYEYFNVFRSIPIGRTLPDDTEPAYLGNSVARWDGDILVIESSQFKEGGWITNGAFTSDALRVTERFTRVDRDLMN